MKKLLVSFVLLSSWLLILHRLWPEKIANSPVDQSELSTPVAKKEAISSNTSNSARAEIVEIESLPPNESSIVETEAEVENAPSNEIEDETPTVNTDRFKHYNRESPYIVAQRSGDYWVVQGDLLIDEDHLEEDYVEGDYAIAKFPPTRFWDRPQIPFVVDPSANRDVVMEAIEDMNAQTLLELVPWSGEKDYLVFKGHEEARCYSFLGKRGGPQPIALHRKYCKKGQVMHEIMHAIGFVHEQSRADRNDFVEILFQNIEKGKEGQFQMFPRDMSPPLTTDFDFDSILMYPPTAFSKNGNPTIISLDGLSFEANRDYLSESDIFRINELVENMSSFRSSPGIQN
ncbi:MAG: hypothetical protein HRU19_03815 [Pseudobacteriovorax sp.]|nr:hypothetical protein [Pseudobacteriovorax sp.]